MERKDVYGQETTGYRCRILQTFKAVCRINSDRKKGLDMLKSGLFFYTFLRYKEYWHSVNAAEKKYIIKLKQCECPVGQPECGGLSEIK